MAYLTGTEFACQKHAYGVGKQHAHRTTPETSVDHRPAHAEITIAQGDVCQQAPHDSSHSRQPSGRESAQQKGIEDVADVLKE